MAASDLAEANLAGVRLQGAVLYRTNLQRANLRQSAPGKLPSVWVSLADGVSTLFGSVSQITDPLFQRFPMCFNETVVREARLSADIPEPWSLLRRTYSGSRFAFVLLLTIVALVPLASRVLLWYGVSQVEQRSIHAAITALARATEALEVLPQPPTEWIGDAKARIDGLQESVMVDNFDGAYRALESGEVILRLLDEAGVLLASAKERASEIGGDLAAVTQAKGWIDRAKAIAGPVKSHTGDLTYKIGPLQDIEERCGDTPPWVVYRKHWYVHCFSRLLAPISVGVAVYDAYGFLFSPVLVPN